MVFMGQEWAAATPFQFFTDHIGELGGAITKGRRREFQSFAAFRDPAVRETIPDPQSSRTFSDSKLDWDELDAPKHGMTLLLYAEFLRLRRSDPIFRNRDRDSYVGLDLGDAVVALLFGRRGEFRLAIVANLEGGQPLPNMDHERLTAGSGRDWRPVLSSNEARFGGNDALDFAQAATIVFEAV